MKTLKYLMGALSVAMLASLVPNPAVATVSGSAHDLRAFTTDAANAELCVFCHTPHNAVVNSNEPPLWNRVEEVGVTITTFTLYTSPTLNNVPGQPAGVSLGCLSCHDGVTALDSLQNAPTIGLTTPGNSLVEQIPATTAALGADLSNDHPVSMAYAGGAVADWNDPPLNSLPLFSNNVECASCHNPHDTTNPKFLRFTMAGSQLCTSCHVK